MNRSLELRERALQIHRASGDRRGEGIEAGNLAGNYQIIDVLCLPSIFGEGLPLIILEALFARCPVVATAVEGTTLAVREGETGFLVAPRDRAGLAERVTRLLLDPELRTTMGNRGRADALERFTPERMIRDLHEVYDRVLAGRPSTQRGDLLPRESA